MPKYLMQVSLTHAVKDFAKDRGSKRRQAADQFFKGGTDCCGLIFAVFSFLGLLMSQQAWAVGFTFTTIGVPGATPFGINDSGQIVGDFRDSSSKTHGFLKSGATFITIDVPGAASTEAQGINDSGQIVGQFIAGLGFGFLKDGATFTSIHFGEEFTFAEGINDSGQIVGLGGDELGNTIGFLKDGATFTTIGVPGATLTSAFGINDSGQIVGLFEDSLGGIHGVLATPVPEPGALFLLAAGLVGLGMAARKRRGKSFL